MTRTGIGLGLVLSALWLGGCAGTSQGAAAAQAPSETPKPQLTRSLFSKDPTGSLSEADLQKVLDAQLDLTFPTRVGVVTLEQAFDPEDPAPVAHRASISKAVTRALEGSPHYSIVTDVTTELPNPAGIEGLRTIAARYRSRYLLLCSTVGEDRSHLNNWAWLYLTGVGLLAVPGQTVGTQGLLEASLLDVKTGTVLFTAVEPYQSSSVTWLIGGGRTHSEVDGEAIAKAAKRLAKQVLTQTEELVRWVEAERSEREAVAKLGPREPESPRAMGQSVMPDGESEHQP